MFAMLGALLAMPLATTYAFAMAVQSHTMQMADAGQQKMPCHKAPKQCPGCPQKVCPELGTCLVKCFQPMPSPVADTRLHMEAVGARVPPAPMLMASGSLIPPLLRPPSA